MADYQIIQLDQVDSTNRYLKDYCQQNLPQQPIFCVTQKQTAGYGQQKRSWLSNENSATFSLAFPLAKKSVINGLMSLQLAKLLHQSLLALNELKPEPESESESESESEAEQQHLFLKWPNDLFDQHGKVAGILIEQVIKKDYRALIIGIGINRQQQNQANLHEDASSLPMFDLDNLFAEFFNNIQSQGLLNFNQQALFKYWQQFDYFNLNEMVKIISPTSETAAIYQGINDNGQAQVTIDQKLELLSSGQTSIRKQ